MPEYGFDPLKARPSDRFHMGDLQQENQRLVYMDFT